MAGTQAQRPTISQHEGTSATRLRTNRTNAQQQQHSQTTVITTTTQSGSNSQLQTQQHVNTIGCSSSSGNGSTIAISTITTAPIPSRVSKIHSALFFFADSIYAPISRILMRFWKFFYKISLKFDCNFFSFFWFVCLFGWFGFCLFTNTKYTFSLCSNCSNHHKCFNSLSMSKLYSTMTTTMLSKLPQKKMPPLLKRFDIGVINVRFTDVSLIT